MRSEKAESQNTEGEVGKEPCLGFCFLFIVVGLIITYVGIVNCRGTIGSFRETAKIKSQGKGTLGTIIVSSQKHGRRGTRGKTYTYYLHTVSFDGFQKTFSNGTQIPIGAAVPVVYMAENPETALFGKPSQTVSEFKQGRFWDIFGLGFGFLFNLFLSVAGSLWTLLFVVGGIRTVLDRYESKPFYLT